jgi:hypothetical protein
MWFPPTSGAVHFAPFSITDEETMTMATAAHVVANRRNAQKSTGPRTDERKDRSRITSLDHGCRANIMVLPTEVFGDYENESQAWERSLKPRNPTEEFLVTRIAKLAWQGKRLDRAHTARLSTRIHQGGISEADIQNEQVIELGQKLFRDACGPAALQLQRKMEASKSGRDSHRISDYSVDENHPMRLVHRLQTTSAGCEWLLEQWAELNDLLKSNVPWLASDKLKAVRLLGRHPIDAIDNRDVARVYLASNVLLKQEVEPFQEILNELSPEEAAVYRESLRLRQYDALVPNKIAAAREVLLDIVRRATERLLDKAEALGEMAALNAPFTADRLSWDDTLEGERLRQYEATCDHAWNRAFDSLMTMRRTGGELDRATAAKLGCSVPFDNIDSIDRPASTLADVVTPRAEPIKQPDLPIEPKSATAKVPNEPNSHGQAPSTESQVGHKDARIDLWYADHNPGGVGTTAKPKLHPALHRLHIGGGRR